MYSFTTSGATPHEPQGSSPQPASASTSAARALNMAQGQMPPPMPLVPPTTPQASLKSHSITHPDGTVVTQTFHNPEQGMLSKTSTKPTGVNTPTEPKMPPIKVVEGAHHIPFKSNDGSIKYINSKGEIS